MPAQVFAATSQPFGCFNVLVSDVGHTLEVLIGAAINADAKHMILIPEDGDVRWSDSTFDPAPDTGIILRQDTPLKFENDRSRMLSLRVASNVPAVEVNCSLWIGG